MAERGRLYRVLMEFTHLSGVLPPDAVEALDRASRPGVDAALPGLSLRVPARRPGVLLVEATVREGTPALAVARVSAVLHRAFVVTGLFEELDVTGALVRLAPVEHADRLWWPLDE